jgi:hypothetical protein
LKPAVVTTVSISINTSGTPNLFIISALIAYESLDTLRVEQLQREFLGGQPSERRLTGRGHMGYRFLSEAWSRIATSFCPTAA